MIRPFGIRPFGTRPIGTRPNGFTLLEMLVALVVFGLLLAGLTQGISYGMRAWQSQVRIATGHEDLDAVDRALRQMIAVMDPGDGIDAAPVSGSADRLEWITVLPGREQRVTAELLVDPAHRLVLRWRPYVHAERLTPTPTAAVTELLRGVSRLELSFWRPTGGWITTWRFTELPALIRIRLIFPPNDPRHWGDIVAATDLDRP